jgi:hypothetical protein
MKPSTMKVRTVVTALVAGCAGVALPTAAYADDPSPSPACGALPSYVEGRPAHLHVHGATGDYLWHDDNGWHLRVTHPAKTRMVFRGVITASSPMTFQRVRDEEHDKVTLTNGGNTLLFRFVNHGGIDGVDFTDSCASTMKVALAVNGHRLGINHIYIGARSARPSRNPFVISRQSAQPAA